LSYIDLGTTYGWNANGQVGLAALNGELILTWGDNSTDYLNAAVTKNGTSWTNVVLSGAPQVYSSTKDWVPGTNPNIGQPPPYAAGGVSMTASTQCGYAYVAYAQHPSGTNVYAARSKDGLTWDYGHLIWTEPNGWLTSAPALYADPSGVIKFAAPMYNYIGYQPNNGEYGNIPTYIYIMQMGQFNCDFTDIQLTGTCFFYNKATGTCQDSSVSMANKLSLAVNLEFDEGMADYQIHNTKYHITGPWTPVWTGADGVELRADAQGNPLGNVNPPIYYSLNQGTPECVGADCQYPYYAGQWANNGLGGAVNPADGTPFLVYSCGAFNGDTCGGTPWIQFYNVSTGYNCTTAPNGNWSVYAPAMTFFSGNIWVAMRGQWASQSGHIAVVSISPNSL
jgi:hypothetical protein